MIFFLADAFFLLDTVFIYIRIRQSIFRLFNQHLRAKVHELRRTKILVRIEKLLASQFALAVLVISILIPYGIRRIGVFT